MGQGLFVELLQISLGTRDMLSRVPSAVEWQELFDEAQRQAVAGILLEGVQRLTVQDSRFAVNLPKELMLQWIGLSLQIEQRNALTTKVCGEVVGQMEKDGLLCCVLKGQANHRYYPEGMSNRRNCGDVDIWVEPIKSLKFRDESLKSVTKSRSSKSYTSQVLEYVDAHYERDGLCWLHCNFTDRSGVPIEVHFHPSFFSRPKYNKRFQQYFSDVEQCVKLVKIDGVEIPAMKRM